MDLSHEDLTSMGVERCTDRKRVLRAVRSLLQTDALVTSTESVSSGSDVREINGVREDASVHFCMLPKPRVCCELAGYMCTWECVKVCGHSFNVVFVGWLLERHHCSCIRCHEACD
jgi:hypothetical protein